MTKHTLFALLAFTLLSASANSQTWTILDLVDEFGDPTGDRAAVSGYVKGNMSFPYQDIRARLMVKCDDVWIRLSDTPNLTSSSSRVKIDEEQSYRSSFQQSSGSTDLDFNHNLRVIESLMQGSRVRIALDWYQQGSSVFEWNLSGSSNSINQSCGGYDPIAKASADEIKKQAQDDLKLLSEIKPMIEDYNGQESESTQKRTLRYGLEWRIRALHTLPDDVRRFRDLEIGVLSDESKDRMERLEKLQKSLANMQSSPLAESMYAQPIRELKKEAQTLADQVLQSGDIIPKHVRELLNKITELR